MEVVTYTPRKGLRKTPLKRRRKLSDYRKQVLARKAAKKAYKRKYGTKSALERADTSFSTEIRQRDRKCLFPGCEVSAFDKLQNSHYIGRSVMATRFDPDNCIALCWFHHFKDKMLGWEYQKQRKEVHGWDGQYTIFMRESLGETRFGALLERAQGSLKRIDAVKLYQDRLCDPQSSTE